MENVEGFREGEEVDIQSTSEESVPLSALPMEYLEKTLRDYAFPPTSIPPVIRRPAIHANNFKFNLITLQLIQNTQFMGFPIEDPPPPFLVQFLEWPAATPPYLTFIAS